MTKCGFGFLLCNQLFLPAQPVLTMLNLLLSILASTVLGLIFKLFPRYGVHTFQAIVVNYIVCVICSWVALGEFPFTASTLREPWFGLAAVLGFIFIITFNTAAFTFQQFGMTIGAVMQKMSILFTVAWSFVFLSEAVTWPKLIGVAAAAGAIWLTNKPSQQLIEKLKDKPHWLFVFPVLTLIFSSVIEIALIYLQRDSGGGANLHLIATLFGAAGGSGVVMTLIGYASGKLCWNSRNILAGSILGVCNFFSIYFLLKLIDTGWGGSVVFPVNNVGIIICAALAAWWLFDERLSRHNWAGLLLAIAAIALIAIGAT